MTSPSREVGKYVLPIMPSIEGIGPEIDRKMGRAFGSIQKQASQALAGGFRDGIAEAEAAIKKSSESIAKLRDKEAAAVDKLAAAEARVEELREKGGSALKRAEAQRNAADRARLAALRDIETQTRSLERAQESLNDAQSESARAGAQSGAGFLAGMRGQLAGAGTVGSEAASSFAEGFAGSSALLSLGARGGPIGIALAAVGVVAGGALVKNVLAGIEREPARDLIQARLRLDDASMAVVGQEAAKAYVNNFGDTVQSNLSAAQLAIQGGLVAGATDPELDGVIAKIQAISQYVDGDLAQTTKSASILLRSGLASSAEEAFDIIAAGYSMTGDLGGDFLDSIGEYSSGWKNAGLSATQALALIKQGSELGVDVTDRSADALREFGRRVSENGEDIVTVLNNIGLDGEAMFDKFKEGGPAGFEAFDQVFDRIRAIEDPTRRNQAAMALLGDTAGDFIDAFAQWDPSAAVDSFGRIEGAAQDAADTMGDNTAGAFESAKRSIELSLDTVQDKLALEFAPILKDAAGQVTENADLITDGFVLGGQAITHFAGITVGMLGGVTQAFGLFAGGIGNVLGGILKTGSALQRLTGDTETADQWNREADAMFGWGEDAQEAGGKLIDLSQSFKGVADSLGELGNESGTTGPKTDWWGNTFKDADTDARNAADSTSALGRSIGEVGTAIDNLPANMPPWYETLLTGGGTAPANPLLGPLGGGGGIPGAGGLAPGSPGSGPGGAPGGLAGLFPGLTPGGGGRGVLMNLQLANQAAGGGGAEQWRPLVQQALAAYGPAAGVTNAKAWEDALVRQINTESGGNPGSVNDNDSNGQGGTQRVAGLLNFLESTYNSHNVTGLPYMDPFGQIAAAIHYTAKKWGVGPDGSPNQIGRGKGFRHGGKATGPGGIDNVPAWLTAGEWVNTVDATRANLPWLEAMNNGLVLPRFEQGGMVPELEQVKRIAAGFGLQVSSSLRQGDSGYHGRGLALDLSNGSGNTPQMLAFAQYMAANFGGELAELIYDAPGWSSNVKDGRAVGPFGEFYTMAQAGDHTDHVHVAVDGAGSGQVQALGSSPLAGVMPSAGPGGAQASAFGAGFQPGQGTPGYNELGEPGYYQTDPRSIAQADRRAQDAQDNIADADARIAEAKAARADLEDDLTATAEQRARADRAIADAEKSAERAREDAVWAQQDAAEARQGRFSAARKATQKTGAGGGGAGDLSPLGGIFGSFFKESLGLDGSMFPDLSQLGIVKMANAILGIGFEPQEGVGFPWQTGYAGGDGTPWSGNPFAQAGAPGEGGSTSGLPFGMIPAAIDAAGRATAGMAPPGTPASGIGGGQAPGPIDNSRHYNVTGVENPDQWRREAAAIDRSVQNPPRLGTYTPPGIG